MAFVLAVLASYVQNMLTEMKREDICMLLGVTREIDKMGVKIRDLKNILIDADRRSITELSVQAWVRELRETMYDATNILDLCQLKATERGLTSRDMRCFNPLLLCMPNPQHAHDIGSCISCINQRLDNIKEHSTSFNFINLNSYKDHRRKVSSSRLGTHETSWGLDESCLVGVKIEEGTRNLVEKLLEEQTYKEYNKIMVFAIVGVGGIGKTTLAQKILNNDIIQRVFTKKIWLSINLDFNDVDVLRRAITEAGGDGHLAINTKATLERILSEELKGHKTLLIMDDVWDGRAWESVLKTPLVNSALHHGSRVLITTRHNRVAKRLSAETPYHHVDKLGLEDAWLLLKKQVVSNENVDIHIEQLKDIGIKIIDKCDGFPLAIKVMGGLLRQKRIRQGDWENLLNDFILSVFQMPEELNNAIYRSIYLSYEDLRPSLKPCFLYFSLLPKGTVFFADEVVGMWISEGFIHRTTSHDLEEIGRDYYDELIQRNLIEPDLKYTDQQVCNMHDVVRSFAQHVARDEALVAHSDEIRIFGNCNCKPQNFTRLSLDSRGSESNWLSIRPQTSLRTLILVGQMSINLDVDFSNLRTLHVRYADFDSLDEYSYKLQHMRYLSIQDTNISRLPQAIGGEMKFLQHINLQGCENLLELPNSIRNLQQLRYLNLAGTNIKNVPCDFRYLTNLRTLYGFPVRTDGSCCNLPELGPLSLLTRLDITFPHNAYSSSFAKHARLREKMDLIYLSLRCTSRLGVARQLVQEKGGISETEKRQIKEFFEELCPPYCLENLRFEGYFGRQLPRWMMSTAVDPLVCLKILRMDDLACCTELPDGLCLLPCLELLQIDSAPAIKHVGYEFICRRRSQSKCAFARLLKLTLCKMVKWEGWKWEKHVKAMPILEELKLDGCKLRHIPPGLAFNARGLKTLYIHDSEHLRSLENFASVVHLDVFRNTSLQMMNNLPKLQKLFIINCPKMKVLEGLPALQSLHLVDYDMETVPSYIKGVKPMHLLLHCSLSLLRSIAAGKSGPEWDKFNHIQQVKAYAQDNDSVIPMKW